MPAIQPMKLITSLFEIDMSSVISRTMSGTIVVTYEIIATINAPNSTNNIPLEYLLIAPLIGAVALLRLLPLVAIDYTERLHAH